MNVESANGSERAKNAIVYHAKQCEEALRLAAFVKVDAIAAVTGVDGMAPGLSKLAAYHSDQAFLWAAQLQREGGAE